jgi:hypothetical protein
MVKSTSRRIKSISKRPAGKASAEPEVARSVTVRWADAGEGRTCASQSRVAPSPGSRSWRASKRMAFSASFAELFSPSSCLGKCNGNRLFAAFHLPPFAATPTLSAAAFVAVHLAADRIRLDFRKSVRSFKGIICDDISEFESVSMGYVRVTGFGAVGIIKSR